ncbi:MAG: LamG-like jellyroll fold domain-containing protein, partial [Opitutales bacterium]
ADYVYPINTPEKTIFRTGTSASLLDGAVFAEGKFGKAVEISASNNKSRVQAAGTGVDIGDAWTVTSWFKELYPKGAWRTLARGSGADHTVIIEHNSDRLGMYHNANGGFRPSGGNLAPAADKDWHHIAAVGSGGKTKLFIDGKLVGTTDRQSNSDVFAIGNYQGGGQRFAKYLDDFRVYGIALSDAEVDEIYGGGGGDFGPTAEISVAGGLETTVFPIPVTIDFKEKGVAIDVTGFEYGEAFPNAANQEMTSYYPSGAAHVPLYIHCNGKAELLSTLPGSDSKNMEGRLIKLLINDPKIPEAQKFSNVVFEVVMGDFNWEDDIRYVLMLKPVDSSIVIKKGDFENTSPAAGTSTWEYVVPDSDLIVNGASVKDFKKVSKGKYTLNLYPEDIPSTINVRILDGAALNATEEATGEASAKIRFVTEKQLAYTAVKTSKNPNAGNVSVLSDGYIPKGHNKGDAWNSGKYVAIANDVDFTFDFDQVYTFSKVRLDYQEWNGTTQFLELTVQSSLDAQTWEQVGPPVSSNNGLQRLPLSTEIDLSGATGKHIKIKMKRMAGSWGPMTGEVTFWASGGPTLSGGKYVQLYANKKKSFSHDIEAGGATQFAAKNLPDWITLNNATGNISGTAPEKFEGTFQPDVYEGLVFWLNADAISGGEDDPVTKWLDESG